MTTSPSEPVDNDQSGAPDSADDYISDSQLPDELQPGPDNPLADPEGHVGGGLSGGDDEGGSGGVPQDSPAANL